MSGEIAILGWGSLLWSYRSNPAWIIERAGLAHPALPLPLLHGYYPLDAAEQKRQEAFDRTHYPWSCDGPDLRIEFSRISASRRGALTLVLDPTVGPLVQVAWCVSTVPLAGTIENLQKREGMSKSDRIGRYPAPASGWRPLAKTQQAFDTISQWASARGLGGVVWTDLASNFTEEVKKHHQENKTHAQLISDWLATPQDKRPSAPSVPVVTASHEQLELILGKPFSVPTAVTYLHALTGDSRRRAIEYIQRTPPFVRTPLRDRLEQMALDRAL
jgi:hypothetical protein